MKFYNQKFTLDYPVSISPMAEIAGFPVCPGLFDVNGAMCLSEGINFTIHTHHGTYCELLLFHHNEQEPYAVLPFPDAYKIGDVYSMIVFGLNIEEFEYAYRIDGPYKPEKGLLYNKRPSTSRIEPSSPLNSCVSMPANSFGILSKRKPFVSTP